MQHSIFSFSVLLLFLHCINTFSQSPTPSPVATPAQSPAATRLHHPNSPPPPPSPGPTDVIQVLLKANHFLTFVRLIKATHVDYQLTSQLNSSTDGMTIFAPTDAAFSNLKSSALGSLNDKQKASFVQFHILPRYLNISDFQTLSNPVETLAGSVDKYPLTISTSDSSVNISTGITKTSISNIVYTDKQVAIFEVDKVLQPKYLFHPAAAAPAAPSPTEKTAESHEGTENDSSGAIGSVVDYNGVVVLEAGIFASSLFYIMRH
ncbi:hypothetical protein JCGZ_05547 [Jatropha curcas]|uniref:FAS1 domain-containing protein n=1 Tax=Jatropha curcas TaxID=180498 RepID=A0A067LHK6_JATCU|nr:fasciclin-like arabinogalactan protein 12 [Jatropha curcas]KDP44080.1 hypothetical protein JCGZ_05547 [Jatropha curcas]